MLRTWVLLLLGVLALSACAPTRPVFPPSAAVQEIRALPDGRWQVTLRVQNYALRGMHFARADLAFDIAGQAAGRLAAALDLEIAETGSDTVTLPLQATPAARAALAADRHGNVAYALSGSLQAGPTRAELKTYPITHRGYLSPVPGLPDAWR